MTSSFILHPSSFARRQRAFSFTEILFAVIILGIGFIMVAGIFPVALQQAKSTQEETAGTALARTAANDLGQLFDDAGKPLTSANAWATGTLDTTNPPGYLRPAIVAQIPNTLPTGAPAGTPTLWQKLQGNLISSQDSRNGFVVLYRRPGDGALTTPVLSTWTPYAQVFIFAVQARNTSVFDSADSTIVTSSGAKIANLMAHPVQVAIANDVVVYGGADVIAFDLSSGLPQDRKDNVDAAIEGAYVIIADDKIATPNTAPYSGNKFVNGDDQGRMNGRVYRLGARRADLDTDVPPNSPFPAAMTTKVVFELVPGEDFNPDAGADAILGTPDDITGIGMNCLPPSTVTVSATADAFIVGKSFSADTLTAIRNGSPPAAIAYEGSAMPVAAYSTYVRIKP